MMMKNKFSIKFFILLFISVILTAFFRGHEEVKVYMIGDSTMADKPLADNPERGWGQLFPAYFNDKVLIENHAVNGRSTKSFIDEGKWKTVYHKLKKGDYVFIQFGHNDEKVKDSTRYADPHSTFKTNLKKFVDESKEKGAIPILLTPVNRRKFDKSGKLVDTHGDYTQAVREVAKEAKVPLIDLYKSSKKLFNQLGEDKTKKIFLWVPANKYTRLPEGKEDNTHFNQYGAFTIAGLVVDGLKESDIALKKYLSNKILFNKDLNKVIGLDYYFNNEWKKDKEGKEKRFHYIWEDTTNSGFSELGNTLTYMNAELSEIDTAPTPDNLNKLDIYIIVDPDTPAETKDPHYIDQASINNIKNWVNKGGILVLMANDSANCEFEHLNNLSEVFGIHFNGDSKNRVIGNKFDMGAFETFPDHPIFETVYKIYLKELSTLKLSGKAYPILKSDGNTIMAGSEYGKGFVFAVGDPWLYNEYFDNRKLPAEFQNYKAGRNLFHWLMLKSNNQK